MELPSFLRSLLAAVAVPAVQSPCALKAVRLLGAQELSTARRRASHALEGARQCACCRSLLDHLYDRVGSTLFLDDDPEVLAQAFDDGERDRFSPKVLAACIVLAGRERIVAPA
ncbi:hypothetical protein DRW03_19610 [Corallococcus sp. H22C18031201]|uniref:hypothetical protein n=1 Tax=Citreicoccus inhibens TaxID=2849499 RepID=UPI000E727015|nr:hypothetical protein [Citreicoccus inhibens]MBU8900943.1 hypothetical protein [Citreicoccus inhibens]RJS19988.1 hypothetical protein DRW03_19610 [Corallococcus sp. H22C18031201]